MHTRGDVAVTVAVPVAIVLVVVIVEHVYMYVCHEGTREPKGHERGSGKGPEGGCPEEGAGTRKQTFLCMYSHDSPMHTAAAVAPGSAIARVRGHACVNAASRSYMYIQQLAQVPILPINICTWGYGEIS